MDLSSWLLDRDTRRVLDQYSTTRDRARSYSTFQTLAHLIFDEYILNSKKTQSGHETPKKIHHCFYNHPALIFSANKNPPQKGYKSKNTKIFWNPTHEYLSSTGVDTRARSRTVGLRCGRQRWCCGTRSVTWWHGRLFIVSFCRINFDKLWAWYKNA